MSLQHPDASLNDLPPLRPIKVLLIEDSLVLSERLRELLTQLPDVELVGSADSETDAIALARAVSADAIILDLHLRQGTGFGVIRALRNMQEPPQIIVLTNYALPQYRRQAESLGVHYFLDKAREFHSISDVLRVIGDHRDDGGRSLQ